MSRRFFVSCRWRRRVASFRKILRPAGVDIFFETKVCKMVVAPKNLDTRRGTETPQNARHRSFLLAVYGLR
jgi:hypothetical protein